MAPNNTGDCFGCHTNGLTPSSAPSQQSGGHRGWQGMSTALLMASINSSGLPLPAHTRSLTLHSPVSRSKTVSPSPRASLVHEGLLGHTHPPGSSWAPGALAGSGDGRGAAWCWHRVANRHRWEETLWGQEKNTRLRQDAVPECPGLHPLWVQTLPGRRDWIPLSPAHTQRSLPHPYTLIPVPAYRGRATKSQGLCHTQPQIPLQAAPTGRRKEPGQQGVVWGHRAGRG